MDWKKSWLSFLYATMCSTNQIVKKTMEYNWLVFRKVSSQRNSRTDELVG